MADDKQFRTEVTADPSPFVAAMKQVGEAAKAGFKQVEESAGGLGKVFQTVQSHLGAITALLAGGAAFKSAIATTIAWTGEQAKLAKQLQVSAEKAAAYQIAAEEVGISGETIVEASDKLTKQMVGNSQAFEKLGISTTNANGSLRSTGEVMPEVIEHLKGIKNTSEQNAQGTALFGKSWTEVRAILKLSAEGLEEARQKAVDLNLVTDPSQLRAYKAAMSDVHLISTSLSVQLGNALLPILVQLGKWFGEVGPYVVGAFSVVLKTIGEVAAFVWRSLKALVDILAGLTHALINVIEGNYAEAWQDFSNTATQMGDNVKAVFTGIGDTWQAMSAKVSKTPELGTDPHVDLAKDKGPKKEQSQMPAWQAELDEFKLAQQEKAQAEGRFYEMSKAEELRFWQAKLELTTAGSKDQIGVRTKSAQLGLAIGKEEFDKDVAQLKARQEAYKNNLAAKLGLLDEEARLVAQKYGTESKEYAAVQGEILKIQREAVTQRLHLETTAQDQLRQYRAGEIAVREAEVQQQLALRKITNAQALALERGFQAERYQIQLEALNAKIALLQKDPDENVAELQRVYGERLALQEGYQAQMVGLQSKALQETQKHELAFASSMETSFGSAMTSMITRTQSWTQTMRQLYTQVGTAFTQEMVTKPLAQMAMRAVRESAIYKMITGTQISTQTSASATTMGVKAEEADGVVTANASEAASGAAASVASTPYVGWALAAAAFAAVMAMVLSAKGSHSAAGGFDIPSGMNPLTQLHQEEMVLPAEHANTIRSLAGSAGGGGDIHIHATDAESVRRLLLDNGQHIVESLRKQGRNFNRV